MLSNARFPGSAITEETSQHGSDNSASQSVSHEKDAYAHSEKQLKDIPDTTTEELKAPYAEKSAESRTQYGLHDRLSSTQDHQAELEAGVHRPSLDDLRSDQSSQRSPMSRVTTDADGNTYPEGGLEAWLVVFGSFMGLFASLGLINTIGTFQAYLQAHQLREYTPGNTGWIFGVYSFLTFFCGVQIGPVFDAKGPRFLVFAGSVLTMAMTIALGFCTQYWHFMIVIGVAGGIGASLIFTPAISAVGHFFNERRGVATGLAATGGSVGGIVFPLVLEALFQKIGWAWATRVVALICLVLLVISCVLVKSRLPKKPASRENVLPDFRIFRDPKFALTTAGIFFVEWGLFVPISYISSYALDHGVSTKLSYQMVAFLNVGSFLGRAIPGFIADFLGRFNTLIVTVALCLVCNACLWLTAGDSVPLMIVYCVIFGFASGSNISLTPVCVGQLCKIENYGRYYATAYTIVSFGTLTGIPIAGEILSRCNGEYWGLIVFTTCCYAVGLACVTSVKLVHVGWRQPWVVY
ncbi:MCT family MFS transporter [Aspergillus clavatus NRRL 1]|uniref:MFS monocarboxylate transporter, putative n=1 Tax=Aspergillus clavatus (strain ATCC 1007 / CBS 513.65 / DSM 816 / NCTC 3887 / NRRL 1 / QM 1276 / 107) TaxID=344612 RepID=A1CEV3_ASPCL|nr:MFS monocarboxylate transporter, putative [Aspergillus clavatus NRRL 1]EAW11402.1 MFS monocarboxylate transporter, putative [Aspergillus clavatus NRRL 1]